MAQNDGDDVHAHAHAHLHHQPQDLPQVLVIRPPLSFSNFQSQYSHKFQFLKAWESPLPLDQFLTTHANSVQALLSIVSYPVTACVLCLLPSLRLIVTPSAGLNHIDLDECRSRGIRVANAGNLNSEDVADVAVGLLIDLLRKISAADRYVRQGLWASTGDYPLGSKVIFLFTLFIFISIFLFILYTIYLFYENCLTL